jgi:agmatine deiminase
MLTPTRNPHLSKAEIEQRMKDYLGQDRIIWLNEGLAGDDTDGHIDDLSRFLNETTIMTMMTDDPKDVNYRALNENKEILQGTGFDIIDIPMPTTRIEGTTVDGSEHVPASYANFYIANGVVLLPIYDKRHDGKVIEIFQHYFPGREIAAIPCQDLVWGQGSIHCITQQLYGVH